MFDAVQKNIITMALMYFLSDYTADDQEDCGCEFWSTEKFEEGVQELIEDFVGPTWDEETTTENIKRETEKRSRKT